MAQQVAATVAMHYGWLDVPPGVSIEVAQDGLSAEGAVSLPAGTTLTTIRKLRGEVVAKPRPHQQEVMGFALWRDAGAAFANANVYPLFRASQGPSADYEGAAHISDPESGKVSLTFSNAVADGDIIDFGTSGGYGSFSLSGWPDYDARMYLDALIVHYPDLYAATGYPGVPVIPQTRYVVGDLPPPPPAEWDVDTAPDELIINSRPTPRKPIVVAAEGKITIIGYEP